MKVSLLVIGNEILNGKIADANTRFLAEFLLKNQIDFDSVMIVRDEKLDIFRAMNQLAQSSEVIITSGGLGPTKDDITKATLAEFLGRKSQYNVEAEKIAMGHYERFQRSWPGKDHEYAQLPEGFVPLSNSSGFAPSFYALYLDKIILSAPGVPIEFKSIIEDHFLNVTASKRNSTTILDLITVRTKRVPEEKIFSEVDPQLWNKLARFGDVSSLPILMGVDICVKTKSFSLEDSQNKRDAILKVFKDSPIHHSIWHYGPDSIEEVILAKAKSKNMTFGFAESATGGLCSHRITGFAGASQSYWGSVICYDESVKVKILGVEKKTLEEFGTVSVQTAEEMARGLADKLKVTIAISITGIAGPSGGTPEKPVGTVCIGISTRTKTSAESFKLFGDREQLKNRFAQLAMLTLLETLESEIDDERQ